jgi:hypothetical protein
MESTTTLIAGLTLALTFGGMTFFSAVVAPLVFTKLPAETAGAFIRAVFPRYYLTLGATTLVALLALLPGVVDATPWEAMLTALILFGFVYARQVLMPRINQARDAELAGEPDAGRRFQRLHRASVAVNGIQWLAALLALVMVLT